VDLQTADLVGSGLRQPGQHGAARVGLDQLLGDPQPIRWRLGADPYQAVRMHATLGQAAGMRGKGRGDEQELTISFHQRWDGATQQAPFAQWCLGREHLGQRAGRPTSTGQ